jgi:hypothetical protein
MSALGLRDTILAIGLPYMASAFGIFLLRQTFKTAARARRPPRVEPAPLVLEDPCGGRPVYLLSTGERGTGTTSCGR